MQMPWKISIADNYKQINYSADGDGVDRFGENDYDEYTTIHRRELT